MQNIALPKKIDFKKGDKDNHGFITVEPLFPGYGMTLGNSLRRVLLSSLPGAAVVGVKIDGADHEFMSLPHIKEDVLEIILNVKKLRLEVFSEEEVKLELKAHGKKEVKAADITKNSNVDIKNPNLVLANITDMAGSLSIEIYVNKGRGYQSVESTEKENKEIGYIQLDSIFSPVLSVSVSVENTRVGKVTNWDKLVLDIMTDGIVSPQEAFEQSVKILIDQFNAFLGKSAKDKKENNKEVEDDKSASAKDSADKEDKNDKKDEKASEITKIEVEDKDDQDEESSDAPSDAEALASKKAMEDKGDQPKKKRGRPKKSD